MDPQVATLLEGVPADFQPTFDPKREDQRIVGALTDLDTDTQAAIRGLFFFGEQLKPLDSQIGELITQGKALSEAHRKEHEEEGFVPGVACEKNSRELQALEDRIETLREQGQPVVEKVQLLESVTNDSIGAFAKERLQASEQLDFCAEGIVAFTPNPFAAILQRLQASGVQVVVAGPGGLTDGAGNPISRGPTDRD